MTGNSTPIAKRRGEDGRVIIGEITYKGDFEPFRQYIRLGEYVHVGKGSSFGLGRYRVGL
jgi:CRISPR/Cas system endoribonuclease Cas6 (RAMP superfamily)